MSRVAKATTLKNLRITEVSLVDRGAGKGCNVLLAKRRDVDGRTTHPTAAPLKKDKAMTTNTPSPEVAKLQKKLGETVAKAEERKATIKDLRKQLTVALMSPEDREYRATLSKADADAYDEMTDEQKAAKKKAQPIDKNLPAHIQETISKMSAMEEELKKSREREQETVFAKRATDLGMPESFGATLAKVGDAEALKEIERVIKALTAQRNTSDLLKEFGTSKGGDAADPAAQYEAVVTELTKGGAMTRGQAILKIAEDPQYRQIFEKYRATGLRPVAA